MHDHCRAFLGDSMPSVGKVLNMRFTASRWIGVAMEGMRRIALGPSGKQHAAAVTAAILRGLGVAPARAHFLATKPLPLFERTVEKRASR